MGRMFFYGTDRGDGVETLVEVKLLADGSLYHRVVVLEQ